MRQSALYVYAIVPAPVEDGIIRGLVGIDDSPLQAIVGSEGVAALVHEAEPVPYQGPDEDVKRWILEHSQVVEHVWEMAGTVLPVTFNVLVRSEEEETAADRLRAWLDEGAASMRERLNRLHGRVELRVEISLERAAITAEDPAVLRMRQEMEGKPPGLRRLLEKKVEETERHAADRLADTVYPDYRRRIAAHVEDLVEQRRSARSAPTEVAVFSAAVLVLRDRVGPLGEELSRIQEEQSAARIRFLGPWPPYAFAEVGATATWGSREKSQAGSEEARTRQAPGGHP